MRSDLQSYGCARTTVWFRMLGSNTGLLKGLEHSRNEVPSGGTRVFMTGQSAEHYELTVTEWTGEIIYCIQF